MKKILILIISIFLVCFTFKTSAESVRIPLMNGSGYLKHAKSDDYVYINTDYIVKDSDFRAVWVTPLVGDIAYYQNQTQYKNEILSVLNNMKVYNLNVMIYHVRIMNDALYKSKYNKWSVYYSENPDWEALPWIIEECHKRGIEFHAWMNPYRVRNGKHNLEELAKEFNASNMASDKDNLLQGTNSVILNPGIPKIKDWLVKVCMEVVENYDVDAIHFDDYFYDAGVDDTLTRAVYNTENLSLGNFRRKQVDDFIYKLSYAIRTYNKSTGKRVQLGISPSGVYRSGDGKVTYDENGNAYSNGSLTTTSFIHYDNYLYSDTLKWINEEWIDYILPQCYWSLEHPMCPYADLLDWWNKVCKYKKVNVYSGIGLGDSGQTSKYSWANPLEAYHQIMVTNTMENVKGISFFSYKTYKRALTSSTILKDVKQIYNIRTLTPEIQYGEKIIPDKISDLAIYNNSQGNLLRFNDTNNSKFYVIYRSEKEVTFSPTEVIDVIGKLTGVDGKIEYIDTTCDKNTKYYYGVKAQSNSLTLGEGLTVSTDNKISESKVYLGDINYSLSQELSSGQYASISFNKLSYPFGTSINYELIYLFDDNNEIKVTNFKTRGELLYTDILVPLNSKTFKATIRAYNNIGESVNQIELSVNEALDPITNFCIVGDNYIGSKHRFVFNAHKVDGLDYTIEYSNDGFVWNEFIKVSSKRSGNNYHVYSSLYETSGKQYYRVKATDGNLFALSNVYEVNAVNKLSPLSNFKINGEKAESEYILNENDVITFEWNIKNEITDMIMYSTDKVNYKQLRTYGQLINDSTEEKNILKLTIPSTEYKVYIKVFSFGNGYESETDLITISVKKDFVFYDELSMFIENQLSISYKETNIFN